MLAVVLAPIGFLLGVCAYGLLVQWLWPQTGPHTDGSIGIFLLWIVAWFVVGLMVLWQDVVRTGPLWSLPVAIVIGLTSAPLSIYVGIGLGGVLGLYFGPALFTVGWAWLVYAAFSRVMRPIHPRPASQGAHRNAKRFDIT